MTQSQPLSIGFISLGCAKNLVDSEIMATGLLAAGWPLAPTPEEAQIVIVNTCAFIRAAREESLAAIFEACSWKRRGPCRAVLVAGCLPQRYQRRLVEAIPEVDAWIGLDAITRVDKVVRRLADGARDLRAIAPRARLVIEPPPQRVLFTGGPFAYLKIAEGCHHHCRFCVIPRIRGRYRSRPLKSILREAETLLASGQRELILIAQDSTAYGRDLAGGVALPQLLRALGALGGRFWIRLLYGHPSQVSDSLLAAMAEVPQVCHYLDIPIQHSHPEMLRAMGRPPLPGGGRQLLERIRRALPDVALRTTCLVGFPGETKAHFRHLRDFVDEAHFDHLGVFAYSREEGTPAARLAAQVAPRAAAQRRAELLRRQQRWVLEHNRERLGKTTEILIEKERAQQQNEPTISGPAWIARSGAQAPEVDSVVILQRAPADIRPGTFIKARYIGVAGYDLLAEPVAETARKGSSRSIR